MVANDRKHRQCELNFHPKGLGKCQPVRGLHSLNWEVGWSFWTNQQPERHINQNDAQWDGSRGNKSVSCSLACINNLSLLQIKPKHTSMAMPHRFKTQELYLSHARAGCEVKCAKVSVATEDLNSLFFLSLIQGQVAGAAGFS